MGSELAPVATEPPIYTGPGRDRTDAVASGLRQVAPEAIPAVARSMPWIPLAAAALVSTLVIAWQHGRAAAVPLQVVAILLSSAAGFALDDPATEILAASPTPLVRRRLLRLLLVVPVVVVAWGLLLSWQGTDGAEETWALMLLFAGLLGLSLGVAGIAGRRSARGSGGIAVPPAIFVLVILSSAIPRQWRPLPLGDVPGGWEQIYLRWGTAAILGTVAFLVSSRDPAARAIRISFRKRSNTEGR